MKLITSFQIKLTVLFTAILFSVTNIWAVRYYSQASGNPTVLTNWNSVSTGGGTTPANFIGEDEFVIQSGHTMTSTGWTVGNASASSIAKLRIENGGIFTGSSTTATSSLTMGTKATLQVDAGGKIIWITNTASTNSMAGLWAGFEALDAASIFEFQGTAAPFFNAGYPDVNGYGNVIFNCHSNINYGINANVSTIRGNLTILRNGGTTTNYNIGNDRVLTNPITIGGNLILDGSFVFRGINVAGKCAINIGGNVTVQNGATFTISNMTTAYVNLNIAGDLTIASGATVTDWGTGATRTTVSFSGTNKTFTNNGTFSTTNLNTQVKTGATLTLASNVDVKTGSTLTVDGTLKCGNSIISGDGNFTLNTGATLIHSNAGGVNAVITATGTKTLNGTVTYDTSTAINTSRSEKINVYAKANNIIVNAIEKGDAISIYTVSGQQVKQIVSNYNQFETTVEKGCYIVKVATKAGILSTKVIVK
jgi:hypothetical protein